MSARLSICSGWLCHMPPHAAAPHSPQPWNRQFLLLLLCCKCWRRKRIHFRFRSRRRLKTKYLRQLFTSNKFRMNLIKLQLLYDAFDLSSIHDILRSLPNKHPSFPLHGATQLFNAAAWATRSKHQCSLDHTFVKKNCGPKWCQKLNLSYDIYPLL